ncbi:hypothetical protein DE146DRAFT_40065 [Phaeosphaeria sp. MPI-PUGE-AT-0046c]|nr:hypothetical protein DE146DRAFT_40065 [Phaeosphaeria sp. MPI-PUGE-AT-0046c]
MRASSRWAPSRAEAGMHLCVLGPEWGRTRSIPRRRLLLTPSRRRRAALCWCCCGAVAHWLCVLIQDLPNVVERNMFRRPARLEHVAPKNTHRIDDLAADKRHSGGRRRSACMKACPCTPRNASAFAHSDSLQIVPLSAASLPITEPSLHHTSHSTAVGV